MTGVSSANRTLKNSVEQHLPQQLILAMTILYIFRVLVLSFKGILATVNYCKHIYYNV